MQTTTKYRRGFTLIEVLVAGGVAVILGALLLTVLTLGMTLYAENTSLNQTHSGGRAATQKLLSRVAAAAELPRLVDDTGAVLTGNGPAAGLRYLVPLSSTTYSVPTAVSATATTLTIAKTASQPAPVAGDTITMFDLGFRGVIASVVPAGSNFTVGLASTAGNGFSPPKSTGTVIPAGSRSFLLRPEIVVSVGGTLRHYPRSFSVAQNGATAFNTRSNFDVMATLLPATGQTNCFPFRFVDPAQRSVDVSLRVRTPAHGGRIRGFYTFQNLRTTVAYRSAGTW